MPGYVPANGGAADAFERWAKQDRGTADVANSGRDDETPGARRAAKGAGRSQTSGEARAFEDPDARTAGPEDPEAALPGVPSGAGPAEPPVPGSDEEIALGAAEAAREAPGSGDAGGGRAGIAPNADPEGSPEGPKAADRDRMEGAGQPDEDRGAGDRPESADASGRSDATSAIDPLMENRADRGALAGAMSGPPAFGDATDRPLSEARAATSERAADGGRSDDDSSQRAPAGGSAAAIPDRGPSAHGGDSGGGANSGSGGGSGPAPQPPMPVPRPDEPRRGGFWPTLLGGALAAGLGAAAIWVLEPGAGGDPAADSALANRLAEQEAALAELQGDLDGMGQALSAGVDQESLEALRADSESDLQGLAETIGQMVERLDAVEARLGELDPRLSQIETRLGELDGRLGEIATQIGEIEPRIAALEGRPVADPQAASETIQSGLDEANRMLEAELAAMRTRLVAEAAAARGEIDAAERRAAELQAEAEAATRAAEARAALGDVAAALETGTPYEEPLDAFAFASEEPVPAALAEPAPTGVATLTELQASFPDAARQALAVSTRAAAGGDIGDRIGAFLRVQSGYRSLEEQAGDDPDAVLSRAEARLREGDVPAALQTLEALPAEGQEAMAAWAATARTRADAVAAAAELTRSVTPN